LFVDGLYGLDYRAMASTPEVIGTRLAALREGKILGTDQCGGVFVGSYEHDHDTSSDRIRLHMHVPSEGELMSGIASGADGLTIDITTQVDSTMPKCEATIDVAGRPVAVKLTYLGPLP